MANKYKVGDRVKVVGWKESLTGKEKFYGKITTIKDNQGHIDYPYSIEDCGWYAWRDEELVPACENKIIITTDGKTTLARLYDGSKVIKSAEAKCSPEDTFDFAIGAKLAYDRLMGIPLGEEKKPIYKSGDKVRVINNTCSHHATIGEVITLTKTCYWGWHYKEHGGYVTEKDIEPYVALGYNGKVVCVKSDSDFKVGKVYEIVDGVLHDEYGNKRPEPIAPDRRIETLDDRWLDGHGIYKFIPYIED